MPRILFCLNFILIPALILGQSKPTLQKYQYELLKTVQLESSAISLNFLPAHETGKNRNIVVTSKTALRWLDTNKPEVSIPKGYLTTVFSKTGQYFGIMSQRPSLENAEVKQITIAVYSARKGQLYSIEQSRHFDDSMPRIVLSEADGSLFLGQNFTGKIYFFNPNGNLIKEIDLFPNAEYDLERVLAFDLNANGSKLAVVAGRRGASPLNSTAPHASAEPHMYLFTATGEQIWQKALPELNTSGVKISNDGQYVVAANYSVGDHGNVRKRSTIFENGNEIFNVDILFKKADFSGNSGNLILADNTEASLFNLASQKKLWRANVPRGEGMITSVKISKNAEVAVLLIAKNQFKNGAFIFTKPRLKILDRTGKLKQEISFGEQFFRKPTLHLSPNASQIVVGFSDSYQIYQVKNEL